MSLIVAPSQFRTLFFCRPIHSSPSAESKVQLGAKSICWVWIRQANLEEAAESGNCFELLDYRLESSSGTTGLYCSFMEWHSWSRHRADMLESGSWVHGESPSWRRVQEGKQLTRLLSPVHLEPSRRPRHKLFCGYAVHTQYWNTSGHMRAMQGVTQPSSDWLRICDLHCPARVI